jgi:hypothetical protein
MSKHAFLAALALLAAATPAAAIPESQMPAQWDKDVARALTKLKVGMDAIQAENVFATIEPRAKMVTIDYRSKIVQEFHVASTKQRVYLNANFYELGHNQTRHKAVLVFQAPLNEYRGNKAKLVKWGLVDNFTYRQYAPVDIIDVKTPAEIAKQQLFKL